MNSAIEQAQHIICISEATRQDLLEFVPIRSDQRVSVIHNGVSNVFRLLNVRTAGGNRPYILFIGQRGGYKNFDLALRALSLLPDLELHCVGGGPLRGEELAGLDIATRGRVRHLGFVSDEQLNSLYNSAFCLLYPSSYEGFGIPVLEAMRAGCPVVCIDSKAVVEVGGSALCVSAHASDPAALAQAVLRLDDDEERQRLRALGLARSKQFSWDQCFAQTLAVYRSL
jgi:mannosyltransferase